MAEGTYEYEVMRAELLGVEKPNYEEFMRKKEDEIKEIEKEDFEKDVESAENQNEELKETSGKLEELNSLISLTQKKIDNFKFRCSSVASYMKNRLGNTLPFSTSVDNTEIEKEKKENPELEDNFPPSVEQQKIDESNGVENHEEISHLK